MTELLGADVTHRSGLDQQTAGQPMGSDFLDAEEVGWLRLE